MSLADQAERKALMGQEHPIAALVELHEGFSRSAIRLLLGIVQRFNAGFL